MKAVARMTSQRVRTIASLNSIMLDGTGMCGSCRVRVAGEMKFVCVDGPEFNAHAVDWNSVINRNKRYEHEEKHACRCK
jgi:NAD(P)H-flavin reductase